MMCAMAYARGAANKGGRPSRGARGQRTLRLPAEIDETIDARADAAGYRSVNDYLCDLIADALKAGLGAKPGDRLPLTA
jgi:predicted HicB family RNase H-like nuclease